MVNINKKTKNKCIRALFYFAIFYIAIPFVSSLPSIFINGGMFGLPIAALIVYFLFHFIFKPNKEDYKDGMLVNGIALFVLTVIFTAMMYKAEGDISGDLMMCFEIFILPFAPSILALNMMGEQESLFIAVFATLIIGFVFCAVCSRALKIRYAILPLLCIVFCIYTCTQLYENRPEVKYAGHGFYYMNGYSSTDFSDYTVYAKKSKLVTLNHAPSFVIEKEEDMPVLDGAEACYPLYSAFAKAVYKDIDKIEKRNIGNEKYEETNGKIVSFTNTIFGFERLVVPVDYYSTSKCDMFFGARPSQEQIDYAKKYKTEIEVTPIGSEAFVFFVEKDNPVDNLTSKQIRSIYHGDIKNWKELGGEEQEIVAFQRPENSGSQTMMEYFMGNIPLKEPKSYETVAAMEGVIKEVAQYHNEDGAIGYTFRYFLEGLNQEKGVKMLSVDGVYPTIESIEDGSYPLSVQLCLITRKNDDNPNVQKMKNFILSDDGQTIVRQTGYGRLKA